VARTLAEARKLTQSSDQQATEYLWWVHVSLEN